MKSKYSLETRIEVVNYVLNENHPKKAAARKFKINKSTVRQWVYAYEHHGIEGLTTKDYFYSGYFKASVVKYMLANELSAYIVAAEFNIPTPSTICKWRRIYLEQGEDALNKGKKEQSITANKIEHKKPEMGNEERKELFAQIKQLKMENDYLKKLNALVQEREESEK
jgi:transposase